MTILEYFSFFISFNDDARDLHSFPTRRSSDLRGRDFLSAAVDVDDVADGGDAIHGAGHLADVADLDGQRHAGAMIGAVGAGADADDVDLLVGEHRRDVAQQALAVQRLDLDVDRVAGVAAVVPADLDHALALLLGEPVQGRAVGAVDGDPLAAGDEAGDGVARDRLAALRHAGEQVADAVDADVALAVAAGLAGPGMQDLLGRLLPGRQQLVGQQRGDLRAGDVVAADGGQEFLDLGETGLVRQLLEVDVGEPQPVQLALQRLAAGGDVLFLVLLAEPG